MLLVMGAMEGELEPIIQKNSYHLVDDTLGREYHNLNRKYLVVTSKIGLTNASSSLSHWLTKYPSIQEILVLGSAGSISPEFKVGDECYITQATYGNADATAFGYQYGQIPQMPPHYTTHVSSLARTFLNRTPTLKRAKLVSSDIFIHQESQAHLLQEKFKSRYDLVDMESAAFFQVAFRFEKPILVIKIVSDSIYGTKNPALSFNQSLPQIGLRLNSLLEKYLKIRDLSK